jgi:hypothetical protein
MQIFEGTNQIQRMVIARHLAASGLAETLVGSLASLGADVAVAEPTLIGRIIAAWPSAARSVQSGCET